MKKVTLSIIVSKVDLCCPFLKAWPSSICSSESSHRVPDSPRKEFLYVITNVACCGVVTYKKYGVRIKGDLIVQCL